MIISRVPQEAWINNNSTRSSTENQVEIYELGLKEEKQMGASPSYLFICVFSAGAKIAKSPSMSNINKVHDMPSPKNKNSLYAQPPMLP